MILKIPVMIETENKYSPYKRILVDAEVSQIRACKYSGIGDGKLNYQALIEDKWVDFLKKEQLSKTKRLLPVARKFSDFGKLIKVGATASSSKYKYISEILYI